MDHLKNALVELSHGSPIVLGGLLLVALLVAVVSRTHYGAPLFPIAGYSSQKTFAGLRARLGWLNSGGAYINEAFEKYPNQIWKVPSMSRTTLVLPPKFLDEIKDVPEHILSNAWATTDFFVGEWTTLDFANFDHANLKAIETQYISKLRPHVPDAAEEAIHGIPNMLPNDKEWSSINLYATIRPLVLQMTTRSIVGPDVCRSPSWHDGVMIYSKNLATTATYMKCLPPMLHFMAYFMPEWYTLHRNKQKLHCLLEPSIKKFLDDRKSGSDPSLKSKAGTMLDCYTETLPESEMTLDKLAHRLVGCTFGAFQGTSSLAMNSVLDLATHFETYAPGLRQEIDEVLGDEEIITNTHLAKMWKLDSFVKEALRFHPLTTLTCNRTVMKPFQLSTGMVIPVGTHISLPGGPMSLSDAYIPNAKTFDGFRWERMRVDPTHNKSGLQSTGTSLANMHMGAGKQQCPGRFFGTAVSKIILINLLRKFDLKLKGEKRPVNMTIMDADAVHPEAEVMIKARAH